MFSLSSFVSDVSDTFEILVSALESKSINSIATLGVVFLSVVVLSSLFWKVVSYLSDALVSSSCRLVTRGFSYVRYRLRLQDSPVAPPPLFHEGQVRFDFGTYFIEYIHRGEVFRFRIPPIISYIHSQTNGRMPTKSPEMALRGSSFYPQPNLVGGVVTLKREDGSIIGMAFRAKTLGSDSYLITAQHVFKEVLSLKEIFVERDGKAIKHSFHIDDVSCFSSAHDLDFTVVRVPSGIWSALGVKALSLKMASSDTSGRIYGYDGSGKVLVSSGMVVPDPLYGRFMHRISTYPGWSGSPIIDPNGFVLGVHLGAFQAHGVNYGVTNVWDTTQESTATHFSKWSRAHLREDLYQDKVSSNIYYNLTPSLSSPVRVKLDADSKRKFFTEKFELPSGPSSWAAMMEDDSSSIGDYEFELANPEMNPSPTTSVSLGLTPSLPKGDSSYESLSRTVADLARVVSQLANEKPVFRTREAPAPSGSSIQPPVSTSSPRRRRQRNSKKPGVLAPPPLASSSSGQQISQPLETPVPKRESTLRLLKNKANFRTTQQSGRSPGDLMEQNTYPSAPMPQYAAVVERLVSGLSRRQFRKYAGLIQDPTYRELARALHSKGLSVLNISILSSIIFSGIGSNWTLIQESLAELLRSLRERSLTDVGPLSLRQLLIDLDFCYLSVPGNLPMFPAGSDLKPSGIAVWSIPSESS